MFNSGYLDIYLSNAVRIRGYVSKPKEVKLSHYRPEQAHRVPGG
jgi:hypothetical protein